MLYEILLVFFNVRNVQSDIEGRNKILILYVYEVQDKEVDSVSKIGEIFNNFT